MARTKKVKFDINNVFFNDQHDQATKNKFLQTALFPVFAAAYNSTNGQIRVGAIRHNRNDTDTRSFWKVMLVTQEGFAVGMLGAQIGDNTNVTDSYSFYSSSGLSEAFANTSALLTTSNPRYLQSKLSPTSTHDALSWLRRSVIEAKTLVSEGVRTLVDNLIDKHYGKSLSFRPRIELDGETTTALAEIAMGKMSINDLSINTRSILDTAYAAYEAKKTKFSDSVRKGRDFVSGDKWVFIPSVNNGVVLAAIIGDGVKDALDEYEKTGDLPLSEKFNYANYSVPPQWYKSMQDIPEAYRSELEYSLTMLKVHRNSADLIPQRDGWGSVHWEEVGSAMYVHNGMMLLLQR